MTSPHLKTVGRWLMRLIPVALVVVAGFILWRELSSLRLRDVVAESLAWGPWRLAGAGLATAASFALLAATEWLGLKWSGAQVPFRKVLLGSFCANAISHVIGFAVLVGGFVRTRLYAGHATVAHAAQTSVFCAVSFGLGMASFVGAALVLHPVLPGFSGMNAVAVQALGHLLIISPLPYIVACAVYRRPTRIGSHTTTLPPFWMAVSQVMLGIVDNAVTALVVWLLVGPALTSFPAFAGAYSVATMTGLISTVPGGTGVFEGVVLTLLPTLARAPLVAALLGYRLIYYIAPLLLAGVLLLRVAPARRSVRIWWRRAAPPVLALGAFVIGAILILTSVGRIDPVRLQILQENVPATILETSHLLSLVAGLSLMACFLLLFRRHASAVPFAGIAALIGASTAMLRGLDIGPAVLTLVLGLLIFASRKAFVRHGSWQLDRMLPWWLAAATAVLLGTVGLGLWVYADTPYEAQLWARVGYHADPARFLRGAALIGAILIAIGVWTLARTSNPYAPPASAQALDAIRPLIEAEPDTTAWLALTGDKALLLDPDHSAFIQYGAEGRSFVAMGDPVGDRAAGERLLWRFKEMANVAAARPVFYHASPRWALTYLDLGLSLLKLGEEARVPVADFSLEGSSRSKLRQNHRRTVRDGLVFELAMPPHAAPLMAELQAISDAWLTTHGGREKGFSLGRFDAALLAQEPLALARQEGRIVAFANLWIGGDEASIDLMRHLPDGPHGVMDFLFIELMMWARDQGLAWFNLGMAPLSGLAQHPLASLWHKVGGLIARRGGRYYGFEGLRAFKAKFDPVWTPRYIAAPPAELAAALLDVTRLIARPVKGS